ncbi:chloride channel protein [Halosquirtibacter xylanolyticus]|uniref:chloride channel protein n=1 Tax=Halosquirtibacter xylanolyticus TaxID=3374599 RepID=UPI003749075F|nr:chloride channel protein [Prolixibacteraceae bacterium]
MHLIDRIYLWQKKHLSPRTFLYLLSITIGIAAGLAAVVIKTSVEMMHHFVLFAFPTAFQEYLRFILPSIGLLLVILFIRYINRKPVGHGIPSVLFAISQREGKIDRHNMYSSIVTSALTVGFGGSVGLEGPTVATGAAIGSNLASSFRLTYKQMVIMLGCACAGAMAAIFKAPITAIVFAVEVIMIDLTALSLIPLILSSATAVLVSYYFLGMKAIYFVPISHGLELTDLPWYIILGVVMGLCTAYFNRIYRMVGHWFQDMGSMTKKWLFGGLSLGLIIVLFPPLFGEGYEAINGCLKGDFSYLHDYFLVDIVAKWRYGIYIIILCLVLFKVFATSFTFGAGGVGGIFAPTLFMGAHAGILFGMIVQALWYPEMDLTTYALLGMAGMIAGTLHGPLTGVFLIAEITGGYTLLVPLMIVSVISYMVTKLFFKNSVYTYQLANRNELMTHDRNQNALSMMRIYDILETDFFVLDDSSKLGDLVKGVEESHRNLFPIVDKSGKLVGMVKMDDIRHLIFKPEKYETITLKELMYYPDFVCEPTLPMRQIVDMFNSSGRYNMAVIDKDGKYLGFISRANVFSVYQKMLNKIM